MIPLKLEFSGLNSYRQVQEIDFSQLTAQGLFGIFGVTGAGKSTVLDAITLALFGQVRRAPRQTQGIINAREKRCFVRFGFSLGSHVYQAERLFERVKNDPFASAVKACRLTRDELTVLADKSNVMDAKLKQLLNMDCERFCQTVILPQGQFDQLLKLRPADRSGLLEELFRFGDYGEALVRRCRERLRQATERLGALEEKLALLGPCSPQDIQDLKRQLAQDEQQGRQLEEELSRVRQEYHRLQALAAQAAERERQLQALARLQAQSGEMEELRRVYGLAQRAEPLRAALDEAVILHRQANEAVRSAQEAAERESGTAQLQQAAQAAFVAARGKLSRLQQTVEPRLRQLDLAAHQKLGAEQTLAELKKAKRELDKAALVGQERELTEALDKLRQKLQQSQEAQAAYHRAVTQALLSWERAVTAEARVRSQAAAALLAQELRTGQPCPVCGSREHYPLVHDAADVNLAAREVAAARSAWQAAQAAGDAAETVLNKLREQEAQTSRRRQLCQQQLAAAQARINALALQSQQQERQWRRLADCDDPQQEAERLRETYDRAVQAEQEARLQAEQAQSELQAVRLQLEAVRATSAERSSRLSSLRGQLVEAVTQAGFREANEAKLALRDSRQREELQSRLRAYDDSLLTLDEDIKRLDGVLRGFEPERLPLLKERAEALSQQLGDLLKQRGRRQAALERAEQDAESAALWQEQRRQAAAGAELLRRLSNLLKGNAFVRYLARGAMLELAHEASDVLISLTNHRFRLEIIDDGRGSNDFIIVDNHNGGLRRQVSGLSGGETFLVSLALALALSRKIQMHAAPLGFFFLDEGFGSLDDSSLEAALSVLEKLPSDKRAVGVITHVREVRERVPRYLLVHADPVRGSSLEMMIN